MDLTYHGIVSVGTLSRFSVFQCVILFVSGYYFSCVVYTLSKLIVFSRGVAYHFLYVLYNVVCVGVAGPAGF